MTIKYKSIINSSCKNKQNQQVILLYGSTLLGTIIGVLNSIINTRFLSPELYGDVRYVQNIIGFISSLLALGYFTSGSRLLALSDNEIYSRRIRGIMCFILIQTIGLLMFVLTTLYFVNINNNNLSSLYLAAIPVCGNALMLNYINTTAQGDNHIGRISWARLVPSMLYCVIAYLVFTLYKATPILMLVLNNGIASIVLLIIILSTKPSFENLKGSFTLLKEEDKRYGLHIYIGSLVGVSTSYIAGISLGQFCETNANVGFYTLALTIATPISTLPAIIGTTYFKRFATEDKIPRKVMMASVGVTAISALLFIVFIKYIVAFLYDERYAMVSVYASWLAVGMCFHGLGDMINRYLGSHGRGREIRNAAITCGLIVAVGSILLVYFYQINGAIITRIIGSMTYLLVLLFYYLRNVKKAGIGNSVGPKQA